MKSVIFSTLNKMPSQLCVDFTTICHEKLPFKLKLTSNRDEIKDSGDIVYLYYNTNFNAIERHSECYSEEVLSAIQEFEERFNNHSRLEDFHTLNESVFQSALFPRRGGYKRAFTILQLNATFMIDDLIEKYVLNNNFHEACLFVTALKTVFDLASQENYDPIDKLVVDFESNNSVINDDRRRDAIVYLKMYVYLAKQQKRGLFDAQIPMFNQTFARSFEMYLDHEFPIYKSIQTRPATWDDFKRKRWLSCGSCYLAVLSIPENFDGKYFQSYESFFALFGMCACLQNDIISFHMDKLELEPLNAIHIAMNERGIPEIEAVKVAAEMASNVMRHMESTYELVPPSYRPCYQLCFELALQFFALATMPRYGWKVCD